MYSKDIKEKAFKLRKAGKSYKEIWTLTQIPKSTLSTWFGEELGVSFKSKEWLEHLARIRPIASRMKTKIKLENIEKINTRVEEEVASYPLRDLSFQKSLLAMLYWAEGSKHARMSGLKFTNTDPKLMDLFVSLLRSCYVLDEKDFRVYLQLHYYHPIRKTKQFWSDLVKVPQSQFHAVTMKRRSERKRFRKNFMGICTIIHSDSDIRREMMAIGQAIQAQVGNYHVV